MEYDHIGRPAGSAYVTFPSAEAAWNAIRDLNYKYIGSRYVELLRANWCRSDSSLIVLASVNQ